MGLMQFARSPSAVPNGHQEMLLADKPERALLAQVSAGDRAAL
jgi:hypothetical protein